jgi:hypothetical protein
MQSLMNLVKFNNGVFKTPKQANYFLKTVQNNPAVKVGINPANVAGITPVEGRFYESVTDIVSWAEGRRAQRPYGWLFEFDKFGVTRRWKLGWNDVKNDGCHYVIDTQKTKLDFERSPDVDVSHLAEDPKPESTSQYVGTEKAKLQIKAKIVFTNWLHSGYFPSFMIKFQDENGNVFVWFSSKWVDLKAGDEVQISGTVKGFNEYNGEKQTIMTRCKIS